MRWIIMILVHLAAALVPLSLKQHPVAQHSDKGQLWPSEFQGVALIRLELSERERRFNKGFPGQIARFAAGDREIVMRSVNRPSRRLHPAADCLRGSGYRVRPKPALRDASGKLWGCVSAEKDGDRLQVCEYIADSMGKSWYDVSSWYWAAVLGRTSGPWTAVTVAAKYESG